MEPEIIGPVPQLGETALGDIMRVRRAVDTALGVARELLPGAPQAGALAAGAVAYHLRRLEENAGGYLSDLQRAETIRLQGELAELPAPWAAADPYAAPLAAAVDAVDLEIVEHEAESVPVREREGAPEGLLEAALILVGLGLLAWALG